MSPNPASNHLELNDFDNDSDNRLPSHNQDSSLLEPIQPAAPLKIDHRSTAFLDGLRGLAALLVYIFHHVGYFYGPQDDIFYGLGHNNHYYLAQLPFLRIFLVGGPSAVAIFFVLSGYVLSVSPIRALYAGQAEKCRVNLLAAAVRRPVRLYLPTLFVGLAFALVLQLPFGLAPTLQWPFPEPSLFAEIWRWLVESLHMMNPFEEHTTTSHWYPYIPPAYTMAVEFQGSIILFVLMAMFSPLGARLRAALFAAMGVIFMLSYHWAWGCFMAGALFVIYDLDDGNNLWRPSNMPEKTKTIIYHVCFFFGWYLLCQPAILGEPAATLETPGFGILNQLIPPNYFSREYWRWWHSWGAMFLVFGLLRIEWLQRFFQSRALRYLGHVSFALYLIHIPVEWTIGDGIYRLLGYVRVPEIQSTLDGLLPIPDIGIRGLTTRFLVCQLFILPINLGLAQMVTSLLDQPSIYLGKLLVTKLGIAPRK